MWATPSHALGCSRPRAPMHFRSSPRAAKSTRSGDAIATYYRDVLEAAAPGKAAADNRPAAYATDIDNIRAALTWAFGLGGDASIGVALAAASAPIWLE